MAKLVQFLKKRKLLTTIFVAMLFAAIIWLILPSKTDEPVYQGKPVSYWLDNYWLDNLWMISNALNMKKSTASNALAAIGTNAIPYYLELAASHPNHIQKYLLGIHFLDWIPRIDEALRRMAFKFDKNPVESFLGFQVLGSSAKSAVPGLIRLMQSDLPKNNRRQIVDSLANIGIAATNAVPALLQNFKLPRDEVASESFHAIHCIAYDTNKDRWDSDTVKVMVPKLTQLLNDTNTDVTIVMDLLGNIGEQAKSAEPAIVPFLTNSNPEVKNAARFAIYSMNRKYHNTLPSKKTQ